MNLADLEPRWIGLNGSMWGKIGATAKFGVSFLCPHCRSKRIAVMFKPAIDPDRINELSPWAMPDAPNPNTGAAKSVNWWARTGDTFANLSLSPSIDASSSGHWHGFITNGVLS
jgi:hypothetical protein